MTITAGFAVERHAALLSALRTPELQKVFTTGMQPMVELAGMMGDRRRTFLEDSFLALCNGITFGETILVSSQAIRLMKFAADSLDLSSAFDLSIVPMQDVVVWFAEPMEFSSSVDRAGKQIAGYCDGFVMHCGEADRHDSSGTIVGVRQVHSYFFLLRYEGDPHNSIRTIAPLYVTDGMEIGVQSEEDRMIKVIEKRNPGLVGKNGKFVAFNPKPLIVALWSLASQPIISNDMVRPIEPGARAARKKLSTQGKIRVLSLRQRVASSPPSSTGFGSGASRHYTHQWIVRGFWRNQRYGPRRSQIKRIWIDTHVKGPADAPLIMTPRAYVVRGDG